MMGITSMAGGAANAAPLPQTAQPVGQPSASSGGWFSGVNSALGNAMGLYAQYESIQAAKNSVGVGRQSGDVVEFDNGAAVVADAPKNQTTTAQAAETMVFGFPQKQVIMAFGGLLVLGLVLKVAKS